MGGKKKTKTRYSASNLAVFNCISIFKHQRGEKGAESAVGAEENLFCAFDAKKKDGKLVFAESGSGFALESRRFGGFSARGALGEGSL